MLWRFKTTVLKKWEGCQFMGSQKTCLLPIKQIAFGRKAGVAKYTTKT
jgi:hypothetical protein